MKAIVLAERSVELRRSVAESQCQLDAALATFHRVSTERLTLGGRMSRSPWGWLAGACAAGLVVGLLHNSGD